MTLRYEIERYLNQTGLAPTTFGRRAAKDPRFVFDVRNGRMVGPALARRVRAWMMGGAR
ncbi:MAG: hypothetical protein KGJ05_09300 [Alphaproteobacteria bacterium]|nr:hypothetical protein [Alphaproteobacteria bacterium]MDE2340210.1 hypothetical protein [Alphaproteobacteria bacterium]